MSYKDVGLKVKIGCTESAVDCATKEMTRVTTADIRMKPQVL